MNRVVKICVTSRVEKLENKMTAIAKIMNDEYGMPVIRLFIHGQVYEDYPIESLHDINQQLETIAYDTEANGIIVAFQS